jgi:hypothetical protein
MDSLKTSPNNNLSAGFCCRDVVLVLDIQPAFPRNISLILAV